MKLNSPFLQNLKYLAEKYENIDEKLLKMPVTHYDLKHVIWVFYNIIKEMQDGKTK